MISAKLLIGSGIKGTPIHESSALQLFIFHIYILSFSFFVIIRNANSHKESSSAVKVCAALSLSGSKKVIWRVIKAIHICN